MIKNDDKIAISVVVPFYNNASFIEKTVESLLLQTFKNFELVLVDNGSTDNGRELVESTLARNPGTVSQLVHIEKNAMLHVARNVGLAAARGEYVSFLDSDDRYATDFLQIMLGEAQRSNADMVICHYDMILPDGTIVGRHRFQPWKPGASEASVYYNGEALNRIFRRSLRLRHNVLYPEYKYSENTALTCNFLFSNIATVDFVGAYNVQNPASFSHAESRYTRMTIENLPAQELRKNLGYMLSQNEHNDVEVLEYFVLANSMVSTWMFSRQCQALDLKLVRIEYAQILVAHFPKFLRNRYIFGSEISETVPFLYRWMVRLYAVALFLRILGPVTSLYGMFCRLLKL